MTAPAPASPERLAELARLVPPPPEHDPSAPCPPLGDGPLAFLAHHYARAWPMIEAALAGEPIATHTRETLWQAVAEQSVQLWPGVSSVRLSNIIVLPTGGTILNVWLVAGDPDNLAETEVVVANYARERGFDGILVQTRTDQPAPSPDYAERGALHYRSLQRWAD